MMNAKRSNIHTMWKYFFLIALLGVLACALNDPAVYAQTAKRQVLAAKMHTQPSHQWSKNTETEGSWFATVKGDHVQMEFKNDGDDKNWSSNSDFPLIEFSTLPKDTKDDFTLTREAGTVLFNGKFDGNQGYGHYKFKANTDFTRYLADYGVKNMMDGDEFAFFMLDVKKEFITMLAANGYKHLSKDELISMTALKVDAAYIAYWKSIGYTLTPDQLVSGKALDLNSAYVDEIRKAGYEHLTFEQLISFKATGVTGKYIAGLHGADKKTGNDGQDSGKPSAEEVVSVKAMNVDDAYVSGIQKEGYSNVSLNDLTSMKAVGVTPEYINELKATGYSSIPVSDLISLKSLGVDPVYVKGFTNLGYKNIPIGDLSSMKATGVTPEFVQGFQADGYKNIAPADLVSIRALGITPAYAKSFDAAGFKNMPVNELSSIKALGITPEYVQSFREIGYKDITVENISSLKALGVTAGYISGFKKIGYNNISLDEVSSLKATCVTPDYVSRMREKGFKSDDLNKYIELKTAFK